MATRHLAHLVAAVLVVVHSGIASAQHGLVSERRDFRDFTTDIWSMWISPARMDRRDVLPIIASVAGVGLTTRFDSTARAWMVEHDRSPVMRVFDPIREGAKIHAYELGSGQYLLPLSGALYVAGRLSRSPGLRDAGLGCAAGHLTSLGFRKLAYYTISRARPRITPDPFHLSVPGSGRWVLQSFFSGHIANSMACASFLSHRYSLGIAEPALYAYSAAIGVGRMADGEHWASDTMTGAIVGFAIGKGIADRQLGRRTARANTQTAVSMNWRAPPIPLLRLSLSF